MCGRVRPLVWCVKRQDMLRAPYECGVWSVIINNSLASSFSLFSHWCTAISPSPSVSSPPAWGKSVVPSNSSSSLFLPFSFVGPPTTLSSSYMPYRIWAITRMNPVQIIWTTHCISAKTLPTLTAALVPCFTLLWGRSSRVTSGASWQRKSPAWREAWASAPRAPKQHLRGHHIPFMNTKIHGERGGVWTLYMFFKFFSMWFM